MFCAWRVFKPEENSKGLLWANRAHLSPTLGLSGGALGKAGLSLLLLLLDRETPGAPSRGEARSTPQPALHPGRPVLEPLPAQLVPVFVGGPRMDPPAGCKAQADEDLG